MKHTVLLALGVTLCLGEVERCEDAADTWPPKQFSGVVVVEAKECAKGRSAAKIEEYPPCRRRAEVAVDIPNQRSYVKWLLDFEPLNATYIRRYDLKREYELKTVCTQHYSDNVIPEDAVCTKLCSRSALQSEMPVSAPSSPPKDATKWSAETEHMKWEMTDIVLGAPDASLFVVPHAFAPKTSCEASPNDNGFPYIRFFDDALVL